MFTRIMYKERIICTQRNHIREGAEFARNRMSWLILKYCRCDTSRLNIHAPAKVKMDNFYEKLQHVFNNIPKFLIFYCEISVS